MKALILAAGRGTRMQPLTGALPKPMVPIINKPALELLIDHLRLHGFDELVINTSYLARHIESHFGDGHRFGVKIAYSFEGYESKGALIDRPLGSAGAIRKIADHSGFFDDTFLVVCGDAIIDLDLTAMLQFHRSRKALATIALKTLPPAALQNYGVARLGAGGRIEAFQEKPAVGQACSNQANTGIYLFDPAIIDAIPPDRPYDIGSELFVALAEAGAGLYGVELPFEWQDIGRLADFHKVVLAAMARFDDASGAGRQRLPGVWIGPNVSIDLRRVHIAGPVYIGGSAKIGDHCTLVGPLVIGAGSTIDDGVYLERTVLLEHTCLSRPLSYVDKVVGPGFCISADGVVLDGSSSDIDWLFRDARTLAQPLLPAQSLVYAFAACAPPG